MASALLAQIDALVRPRFSESFKPTKQAAKSSCLDKVKSHAFRYCQSHRYSIITHKLRPIEGVPQC